MGLEAIIDQLVHRVGAGSLQDYLGGHLPSSLASGHICRLPLLPPLLPLEQLPFSSNSFMRIRQSRCSRQSQWRCSCLQARELGRLSRLHLSSRMRWWAQSVAAGAPAAWCSSAAAGPPSRAPCARETGVQREGGHLLVVRLPRGMAHTAPAQTRPVAAAPQTAHLLTPSATSALPPS